MGKSVNTMEGGEGLLRRVKRSIVTEPLVPRTDQERKRFLISNLILHFRPTSVPEATLKFTLTWGLGGMAAVLVLIQIFTGVMLKFIYEPFPARAYDSILYLQQDVLFGQLVRNVHHWSANFLIFIVFLHFLRVFLTGAIHAPRQFNWVIGLAMFGLVLLANFTGYLLPWDQLAYWAVTIVTGMLEYVPVAGRGIQQVVRGGEEIGPATLRIFLTLHTAVVPVFLVLLMAFHFWRIRRAGGLVVPRKAGEERTEPAVRVLTMPNLIVREVVVALALIAGVLLVSTLFDAPLGKQANPGLSPNPTKAPWYFAGLQELLLHFHPLFAVLVIPAAVIGALVLIPYLSYQADTSGVWFGSKVGRRTAWVSALTSFALTPLLILLDEYLDLEKYLPGMLSGGLIPAGLILAFVVGYALFLKRRFSLTTREVTQAVFVMMVVALVVMTAICVWFRGEGMALQWPFGKQ
jgi:quinol-cytochrome oxidoreductase complex cytochrome b subunit